MNTQQFQQNQKPSPEVIQTYLRLFQESSESWKFGAKYLEVLTNKIMEELKETKEELDSYKKKYDAGNRRIKSLEQQLTSANEKIKELEETPVNSQDSQDSQDLQNRNENSQNTMHPQVVDPSSL